MEVREVWRQAHLKQPLGSRDGSRTRQRGGSGLKSTTGGSRGGSSGMARAGGVLHQRVNKRPHNPVSILHRPRAPRLPLQRQRRRGRGGRGGAAGLARRPSLGGDLAERREVYSEIGFGPLVRVRRESEIAQVRVLLPYLIDARACYGHLRAEWIRTRAKQ